MYKQHAWYGQFSPQKWEKKQKVGGSTDPIWKKNMQPSKNGLSSSSPTTSGTGHQAAELSGGTRQNHLGAGHGDAVALGRQDLRRTGPGGPWPTCSVWNTVQGNVTQMAYDINI